MARIEKPIKVALSAISLILAVCLCFAVDELLYNYNFYKRIGDPFEPSAFDVALKKEYLFYAITIIFSILTIIALNLYIWLGYRWFHDKTPEERAAAKAAKVEAKKKKLQDKMNKLN